MCRGRSLDPPVKFYILVSYVRTITITYQVSLDCAKCVLPEFGINRQNLADSGNHLNF